MTNVNDSHGGVYACAGVNDEGSTHSELVTLDVICKYSLKNPSFLIRYSVICRVKAKTTYSARLRNCTYLVHDFNVK